MLLNISHLEDIAPEELDLLLSNGWFRGATLMYRTKVVSTGGHLHSVINIRLNLKEHVWRKSLKKLKKRNDDLFRVEFKDFEYSDEKEALYQSHKNRFQGFIFDNLESFFVGEWQIHPYQTKECCVYYDNKLVAVSYFDLGSNSMASLLGLYDKDFEKHSLGRYTMLLEIEKAQELDCTYYYPGYILSGERTFDYKLSLGEFNFYNWSGKWQPMHEVSEVVWPADVINKKLQAMSDCLNELKILNEYYTYPYYSLAYLNIPNIQLLKSACFLKLREENNMILLMGYNFENERFDLQWVGVGNDQWLSDKMKASNDENLAANSYNHLLRVEKTLATSITIPQMKKNMKDLKLAKLL